MGIDAIASSLKLFGEVVQRELPPIENVPARIELILGSKGTISFPKTAQDNLTPERVTQIQSSLCLFFAGQITSNKLEKRICTEPQLPIRAAIATKILEMGTILRELYTEDLTKMSEDLKKLDRESLESLWNRCSQWFAQVPNKEQLSLEDIIDNRLDIDTDRITTLRSLYQALIELNAKCKKPCCLIKDSMIRGDEARPRLLIEAENALFREFDFFYDHLLGIKQRLYEKVVAPYLL